MAFDVSIFSRNITLDNDVKDQIERKVAGLEKYLEDIIEARVDLSSTNARNLDEREVVQITVQGKGFILRAEERSSDIVNALNLAVDTLQKRIRRFKGKRSQRWKQAADVADIALEKDEDWEEPPVIARRKQFYLRPMDEWEAIEQMELLGHTNFFVFYNAQTEAINVLYRRYDGSLGLIQPEIG
jgi:putative sigma-54 modulation protein